MSLNGLEDVWSLLSGRRSRIKFIKFGFANSRREVGYQRSTVILRAVRRSPFETVMQNILRHREKNGAGSGGEIEASHVPSLLTSLPYRPYSTLPFLLLFIKPTWSSNGSRNGLTAKGYRRHPC